MSIITSIRKVSNGSLQGEIMDKVQKPGRLNVLAKLNVGDERFNQGSPRRAWFPVTLASLKMLGFSEKKLAEIEAMEEGDKVECHVENPTIDGEVLRIQITETVVPDAWQRANTMKAAKQISITEEIAKNKSLKSDYNLAEHKGKNAYFLDAEGNFIFSRGTVTVESQLNHVFIEGTLVPETELANYGATLADPVRIQNEVEAPVDEKF